MRQSNCSVPNPPRQPRGHHFFGGCPGLLSLHFSLVPPYINTIITLFSSAPPLFITHIFCLTQGLPQGDGSRKIWPAHYSNMRLGKIHNEHLQHFFSKRIIEPAHSFSSQRIRSRRKQCGAWDIFSKMRWVSGSRPTLKVFCKSILFELGSFLFLTPNAVVLMVLI